ncbi:MAG: signal peptidase I, partial [Candidatus Coatesbacteria bacterium]|nr:signal peptidase I [Candidatus Coatesbacteria bacterium]
MGPLDGHDRVEPQPEAVPDGGRRVRWWHYPAALLIAVAVALLLRAFVFQASWVPTASMHPTLLRGDFIIINRLSFLAGEPERGDVIVFHRDGNDYVKRVAAVPGESFRFQDGHLWVEGERIDERAYIAPGAWGHTRGHELYGEELHRVPPERYLVLGDNRLFSRDSRFFGLVDRGEIIGSAFLIYLSVDLGELEKAGLNWWSAPWHLRLDRILD